MTLKLQVIPTAISISKEQKNKRLHYQNLGRYYCDTNQALNKHLTEQLFGDFLTHYQYHICPQNYLVKIVVHKHCLGDMHTLKYASSLLPYYHHISLHSVREVVDQEAIRTISQWSWSCMMASQRIKMQMLSFCAATSILEDCMESF